MQRLGRADGTTKWTRMPSGHGCDSDALWTRTPARGTWLGLCLLPCCGRGASARELGARPTWPALHRTLRGTARRSIRVGRSACRRCRRQSSPRFDRAAGSDPRAGAKKCRADSGGGGTKGEAAAPGTLQDGRCLAPSRVGGARQAHGTRAQYAANATELSTNSADTAKQRKAPTKQHGAASKAARDTQLGN